MDDRADHDREETAWIERVRLLDDHDAFALLVRRHQAAVRGFLRRLTLPETSRADDLAQDTFLKAYRYIRSFEGRGRFLSWLFRIAYQEFVSDRRRGAHVVHVALDESMVVGDASREFAAQRTFDQLLSMLDTDERAAMVLHYRHQLTHMEIAETLALPLGTVKTLIRRARLKLEVVLRPGPLTTRSPK